MRMHRPTPQTQLAALLNRKLTEAAIIEGGDGAKIDVIVGATAGLRSALLEAKGGDSRGVLDAFDSAVRADGDVTGVGLGVDS